MSSSLSPAQTCGTGVPSSAKAELRAAALARRDAMPAAARDEAAAALVARLEALMAKRRPRVLAGYWPIRTEADIRPALVAAAAAGTAVALPALAGDGLVFRRWRPGDGLSRTSLRFLEPTADREPLSPEVILLPLAAFDRRGHRLGYGRGYYDRALGASNAAHPPLLVGVGFACQEIGEAPAEAHDVALDLIVTEAETIAPHANTSSSAPGD